MCFPEGSRQKENTIGKIKPGIFAIQKEINNMVYPIYINSGKAWPKSGRIKKNDIMVKVLNPIKKGLQKKTFLGNLTNILNEELKII